MQQDTQQSIHESNSQPVTTYSFASKKHRVLQTIFKYNTFREKQDVIDAILSGRKCLIVLPVGAAKTLCFTIPALISGGVTLVISLLLSLMVDQAEHLRSKGISVSYINSSISADDKNTILHNMVSDKPPYNFVYVIPETATTEEMKNVLEHMKTKGTLTYIVVESHCVDTWEFDFRPAYGDLGVLSKLNCPIVALTATCTSRIEKVIISSLQLIDPVTIRQTCNRENIILCVKQKGRW